MKFEQKLMKSLCGASLRVLVLEVHFESKHSHFRFGKIFDPDFILLSLHESTTDDMFVNFIEHFMTVLDYKRSLNKN